MRVIQFILLNLLLVSHVVQADTLQFNLTEGVTPISHDIYQLHMLVFFVCVGIGLIVFSTMTYSILFHRKSKGKKPAEFHEHLWLELAWTIAPFLILVALAIPGTRVLMNANDYNLSDLTIKVTGYQWRWQYDYIEQNIRFFSNLSTSLAERSGQKPKNPLYLHEVDHPLVVPIHQKIRFLVTSNDVLHSWSVPDLGVKREAVPGFINETWARINRPGIYYGQCAELCGLNHAYMPIVVVALTEKDFIDWLAKQKGVSTVTAPPIKSNVSTSVTPPPPKMVTPSSNQAISTPSISPVKSSQPTAPMPSASPPSLSNVSLAEQMKQGETIFQNICAACHQVTGEGLPPTYPALKNSALVKGPLPAHIDRVLNGKPGTAMQAFRDQLSDEEMAAVITYERNAWGNNTGDSVQPEQIKAARDNQGVKP